MMGFHLDAENFLSNDMNLSQEFSRGKITKTNGECIAKTLNLVHILPEDRDDRRAYIKLCIKKSTLPKHRYSAINKKWLDDYLNMLNEDDNDILL